MVREKVGHDADAAHACAAGGAEGVGEAVGAEGVGCEWRDGCGRCRGGVRAARGPGYGVVCGVDEEVGVEGADGTCVGVSSGGVRQGDVREGDLSLRAEEREGE